MFFIEFMASNVKMKDFLFFIYAMTPLLDFKSQWVGWINREVSAGVWESKPKFSVNLGHEPAEQLTTALPILKTTLMEGCEGWSRDVRHDDWWEVNDWCSGSGVNVICLSYVVRQLLQPLVATCFFGQTGGFPIWPFCGLVHHLSSLILLVTVWPKWQMRQYFIISWCHYDKVCDGASFLSQIR